ncbi:MAG: D-alanine--D-alanine ligase family protein [Microgenomates group bacterium]
MKQPNVLIIKGGRSAENEVSLRSAKNIESALKKAGFSVAMIEIERNGAWGTLTGDVLADGQKFLMSPDQHDTNITEQTLVVFPVLHGPYGEDGTIQGFFELANIPYVGCGVRASALGMHKGTQKELFAHHGLRVSPWIAVKRFEWEKNNDETVGRIASSLKNHFPFFVKPICTGSSVGISKVSNTKELKQAMIHAFQFDNEVIVEQGIAPLRELEVAVLGNDQPEASVVGEIVVDHGFYDYESKYSSTSKTITRIDPDDLDLHIKNEIRKQAVQAYTLLGCAGLARVDFLVSGNVIYVNEINTMPGFTAISMYPKLWEATGVPFTELCTKLIRLAQESWKIKQSIKMTP